jgi:predicted phosphoribosyltransferase
MGSLTIIVEQEELFADRDQAAEMLYCQLADYQNCENLIVLGIPRGGMILADRLAGHFNAGLDIVLTRKIRALHNPELAVGAVSEDGLVYLNKPVITALGLSDHYIEQEKDLQMSMIQQLSERYRSVLGKVPLHDKTVILTDDGVATGATIQAAMWAVRAEYPNRMILAIPVAPPETLQRLSQDADETVCLCAPSGFHAISQFYTCFEQVPDEQIIQLLEKYANVHAQG